MDNFYFIHIHKTGGSSVFAALSCEKPKGIYQHHKLKDLLTGYNCHKMTIRQFKKLFSFTIIRNPWERIVSFYESWILQPSKKAILFDDWVSVFSCHFDLPRPFHKEKWLEQYEYYKCDQLKLNKIYKLNELNIYWPEICDLTIKKQVKLPHKGSSNHRPYQEYYNNTTKKKVEILCEKDIDLNKWTFNND